jgi:hypothetical protein
LFYLFVIQLNKVIFHARMYEKACAHTRGYLCAVCTVCTFQKLLGLQNGTLWQQSMGKGKVH